MARILIAGCGDIGITTGQLLVDDGHEVVGLRRHPPANDNKIKYIKADLAHSADLDKLDTRFDLVIYILTPDDRSEQSYRNVFELGVTNLLNIFSKNDPGSRFIFVSSTSVYGQTHGEWVDEESVTGPDTVTGKIILQAEKSFLAYSSRNCIIRFSGIYGRNRSRLLDSVTRGGKVQYKPPYYTNRIHCDDCVAVLRYISNKLIAGVALEPIYLASDDDPAAKWDVYNHLADQLGAGRPEKQILPHSSDQNKRCSNRRLKQLGYSFIYKSYREGYDIIERLDR